MTAYRVASLADLYIVVEHAVQVPILLQQLERPLVLEVLELQNKTGRHAVVICPTLEAESGPECFGNFLFTRAARCFRFV